jgi:hypothetical protein
MIRWSNLMKFTLAYQRALMGNDIAVQIQAEGKEVIANVQIALDGFDLANEGVDPPAVQYQRSILQAGDAAPHKEHNLIVTATDTEGKARTATRRWQDVS